MAHRSYFNSKTVIITGASSGIGYSTALMLSEMNAKLVLVARRKEKLENLENHILLNGGQAISIAADISVYEQVQNMIEKAVEYFGKIDILIVNAGQYIQSSIIDAEISHFEKSIAVNFYGALYSIKCIIPYMVKQGGGSIAIVNSLDSKKGIVGDAPYVASKCALDGFADVLRQEMKKLNIRITSIYPGRVDTPMVNGLIVPNISRKIKANSVAKAIIKGIAGEKAIVTVPGFYFTLGALNNLFPKLMDWFYAKFKLEGRRETISNTMNNSQL
jgi:NADP-dependent 3-hydroxy acid dehydrogenase YdfG